MDPHCLRRFFRRWNRLIHLPCPSFPSLCRSVSHLLWMYRSLFRRRYVQHLYPFIRILLNSIFVGFCSTYLHISQPD